MPIPAYDEQNYLGEDPGLTRVYDNIMGTVPGVLFPAVKMVVWNAIEEFYWRSTWRREYLDWCMPPGVTCVDFNPFDANWLVCWILDIYGVSGYVIRPPASLIDVQMLNTTSGTRQGRALVSLKPISLDSEFDPQLFMNWFETILDGALYRLYLQPAKPYTSPQLAQVHARQFRVGCTRAKSIAQKQYTNGHGRWSYPYFAGQTGAPLGGDILGFVGRTSGSGGEDDMPGPPGPPGPQGPQGPPGVSSVQPYRLEAPASGAIITLVDTNEVLALNPAGSLALLTVSLAAGTDMKQIRISTRQRIDALIVNPFSGNSTDWVTNELPKNGFIDLRFIGSLNRWIVG